MRLRKRRGAGHDGPGDDAGPGSMMYLRSRHDGSHAVKSGLEPLYCLTITVLQMRPSDTDRDADAGGEPPEFCCFRVKPPGPIAPVIGDLSETPPGLVPAVAPFFGGPFTLIVIRTELPSQGSGWRGGGSSGHDFISPPN